METFKFVFEIESIERECKMIVKVLAPELHSAYNGLDRRIDDLHEELVIDRDDIAVSLIEIEQEW